MRLLISTLPFSILVTIHGCIGQPDELVSFARLRRIVGEAGAQDDVSLMAVGQAHHRRHRHVQPIDQPTGCHRVVQTRQQHRKFVATQPKSDIIRSQHDLQPGRNCLEDHVARLMTMTVVDQLEIIGVTIEQAQRLPRSRRFRKHFFQPLLEQRAVADAGQGVLRRPACKLRIFFGQPLMPAFQFGQQKIEVTDEIIDFGQT